MQVLGLSLDPPYIHLAVIEKKGGIFEIRSLKTFLIEPATNVKQLYIPDWKGKISTSLGTLVRHLEVPDAPEREIIKGIAYQVESISPLPIAEIQFFFQRNKKTSNLFIVSKEKIAKHIDNWKKFEIEADLTTSIFQAQLNFFQYKYPKESSTIMLHLGADEWNCLLIENNQILRSHTIPIGINDLLHAFWEDRKKVLFESEIEGAAKQIDLLLLKSQLNPSLSQMIEQGRSRLTQTISSFMQDSQAKSIIFTGRVDAFYHLKEYLTHTPLLEPRLTTQEALSAISLGTAIENFETDPVQFLTNEFYPKKLLRQVSGWVFGSLAFSLIGSIAISIFGSSLLSKSKNEMAKSLQTLFNRSEAGLGDKFFEKSEEEGFQMAAKLVHQSSSAAYFLTNNFSVTQFLHDLTSHPLYNSIEIKDISYEMISYPKIGEEKNSYQVKIQLEFASDNTSVIRKLHETLLAGDWIADASEEIIWEPTADSVRATFILRAVE